MSNACSCLDIATAFSPKFIIGNGNVPASEYYMLRMKVVFTRGFRKQSEHFFHLHSNGNQSYLNY